MDLSIIIPVLNEKENVKELAGAIKESLSHAKTKYEIIFVDDGSTDGTADELEKLSKSNSNISYLQFTKNFGKAAALNAGFSAAKGDYIITMDGDLQDNPEEIPNFLKEIKKGYDVVIGWKYIRQDPWHKTAPSKIFNWLIRRISGLKTHDCDSGYKIMTREAVSNLNIYEGFYRHIPVFANWKGFKVSEIKVHHRKRVYGKSKYGISRFIYGTLDLITLVFLIKFSKKPMYLFGITGAVLTFIAAAILAYLAYVRLIIGEFIGQRPLLLLGFMLALIGLQLIFTGFIAEMIVEMKQEHKKDYVIKKESK